MDKTEYKNLHVLRLKNHVWKLKGKNGQKKKKKLKEKRKLEESYINGNFKRKRKHKRLKCFDVLHTNS